MRRLEFNADTLTHLKVVQSSSETHEPHFRMACVVHRSLDTWQANLFHWSMNLQRQPDCCKRTENGGDRGTGYPPVRRDGLLGHYGRYDSGYRSRESYELLGLRIEILGVSDLFLTHPNAVIRNPSGRDMGRWDKP